MQNSTWLMTRDEERDFKCVQFVLSEFVEPRPREFWRWMACTRISSERARRNPPLHSPRRLETPALDDRQAAFMRQAGYQWDEERNKWYRGDLSRRVRAEVRCFLSWDVFFWFAWGGVWGGGVGVY